MPKIGKSVKKITWFASALLAAAIILLGFFTAWGTATFDEFVFFAVIAAFIPPTFLNYLDYRWKRAVDEHLPDLFRSIVQAQETGMTLPRALEEASKRNYGPLTVELQKMNAQISWGMTLEEALVAFAKRVDTVRARPSLQKGGGFNFKTVFKEKLSNGSNKKPSSGNFPPNFLVQAVGVDIFNLYFFKGKVSLAISAEMSRHRYVKAFAAVLAGTPYSCLSIVHIWLLQFFMALGADKLVSFSEVFFNIHMSAFNMLD